MKRRVAIIGSVGVPARYGGFETLADRLCSELSSQFEISVYCSAKEYEEKKSTYKGAKLHYIPLRANGISGVLYDIWSIVHALRKNHVLLILGVTGCICLPLLSWSKTKTIVHIDGLEWKRDKWQPIARSFLRLSEKLAMKYADEIILDNEALREIVTSTYGNRDYQLITYGSEIKSISESEKAIGLPKKEKYLLALCRIVPENNVRMILSTISKLPHLKLIFIGNWNVNSFSRTVYKQYKDFSNIELREANYNQNAIDLLRKNCSAYIHGHSAGGTNPSLVEAMGSGAPVFAYDARFNRETMKSEGIFFKSEQELAQALQSFSENQLLEAGNRLKQVALDHYQWSEVAASYGKLFAEVNMGPGNNH